MVCETIFSINGKKTRALRNNKKIDVFVINFSLYIANTEKLRNSSLADQIR